MKLAYPIALGLVASIIAVLPALLPGAAQAGPDDRERMEELFYAVLEADDPAAYVAGLSDEDRTLWEKTMEVVEVKEDPTWQHGEPEQFKLWSPTAGHSRRDVSARTSSATTSGGST